MLPHAFDTFDTHAYMCAHTGELEVAEESRRNLQQARDTLLAEREVAAAQIASLQKVSFSTLCRLCRLPGRVRRGAPPLPLFMAQKPSWPWKHD